MTEAIIVALITGGISLIGTLAHIQRPITTSCMDYAVKAAMFDGKGAAWTDAERLDALARIGCTVGDDGTVKWSAV